jgi:hypothetical protein
MHSHTDRHTDRQTDRQTDKMLKACMQVNVPTEETHWHQDIGLWNTEMGLWDMVILGTEETWIMVVLKPPVRGTADLTS